MATQYFNATAGQRRPSGAAVGIVLSNSAAPAGDVSVIVNNTGNFTSKSQLRLVLLEILDQVAQAAGLK